MVKERHPRTLNVAGELSEIIDDLKEIERKCVYHPNSRPIKTHIDEAIQSLNNAIEEAKR